ncbi:HupE/UreJ family protein [Ruegeria sp. R14_0]|uniref:HupE/UreJ family protein n=1 Tax=Ruegeria sp. R14_0 TaxID=2821100 RepID=UPI001ADCB22B|nr:HupE/UreJ family protein [Ruegeria sp. R14_0]MBO9446349.1 HupE/UreJ family protein [Ruegeria sp. R14_0]
MAVTEREAMARPAPCSTPKTLGLAALFLWLGAFLLTALATPAHAHRVNETYVYFDVTENTLSGRIEVTLTDLARIQQGLPQVESALSEDEVRATRTAFFDYFKDRLKLSANDQPFQFEFDEITFFGSSIDTFAQFHFNVVGVDKTPTTIQMSYDGLLDVDPGHRGFALIGSNSRNGMDENEAYISLVFAPGDGKKDLYLNDEPIKDIARLFFENGVWHIWLGFDHLLFLITLLLCAVMRIENDHWVPSDSIRDSLWPAVKIVTLFTIANTIALSLATYGIITLPVTLVEAVIAFSIAAVALGNLIPRFHASVWKLAVLFGIFHGFGFASVLEPLGLDASRKATGLATFNIGIEIGQLAVVMVLFPIFFILRRLTAYRVVFLQFGSMALIAFAILWFFERTLGWFPQVAATASSVIQ